MSERPLREARVDLEAIAGNVEALRAIIGTPHFLAVVKTNGYGHGAVATARAALAGGADWLGVIDATEARELRAAGITAPILTWLHAPNETFESAADDAVDIGVNSIGELDRAAAGGARFVHLKVDTGLGRNGAEESTWGPFFERARALESTGGPIVRGLFSHLANAGDDADAAQLASFERARVAAASFGLQPELLHVAATEAALARPVSRYSMVRIGLGCYGLSPFDGVLPLAFGLKPALELSASIVSVKRVPAGVGVSYGHRYRTERETSLALVPLGYGDGVPRHGSGRGPVSIKGTTFTVSGTIAMDQFVVDVGDAVVSPGDRAILFGDPEAGLPRVADWAEAAETVNYEIISRLGPRIERVNVGTV